MADITRFPDNGVSLDPVGGALPTLGASQTGAIVYDAGSAALVRWSGTEWLSLGGGGGGSQTWTDIAQAPNGTVNLHGWFPAGATLTNVQVLATTVATVGTYTLAVTKDPFDTDLTMLSAATYDLTTGGAMSSQVPNTVALTATSADLILAANDVWQIQVVSNNVGLDVAGLYVILTWE